jgi:uncharacterized protein YneF (UPF0154 family)
MNDDLNPLANVICFGLLLFLIGGYFASREVNHKQLNNYLKNQGQEQVK